MRPLLAAFLLLAVACALPSATTASKRSGCYPRDSVTVRENRQARFFAVDRGRYSRSYSYYGCLFRTGRPRPLRDNPYEQMTGRKLAGRFVAYRWEDQTTNLTVISLARFDIRSGRTLALDAVSTGWSTVGSLPLFLATRAGAVVWVRTQYEHPTGVRELRKFDRGGVATLATGDYFHSVRLSDDQRRVLWHDGQVERSARLR